MKMTQIIPALLLILITAGLGAQEAGGGAGLLLPEEEASGGETAEPSSLGFGLRFTPGIELPLGASADYFGLGAAGTLSGEFSFATLPRLFAAADIGYNLIPINNGDSVSIIRAGGAFGAAVRIIDRLSIKALASGGYYYGFLNTGDADGAGRPYFTAGAGLDFMLSPSFDIGLEVSYRNYLGLYDSLGVVLGASLYLSGTEARESAYRRSLPARPELLQGARTPGPNEGIRMSNLSFNQVFPVFYKYYDDNPIGSLALYNQENEELTDVSLAFNIKQYMDAPKVSFKAERMASGDLKQVDIFALFNDSVMGVTEGTKTAAEIILEYRKDGELYRDVLTETVRLYDRQAMTWDDDRKAAAFVTAKDPKILTFAKNVAGMVRDQGNNAVNRNLLTAMGLFNALELYGVSYIIDPTTPYAEYSETQNQVDFLQFPRQTLEYGAGDCDDLSILYSAILEAVGLKTAFVTVPGHIYMAFSINESAEKVKRLFYNTDDVILMNDEIWIPVELTVREGGFIKAWQEGARQWREYRPRGQAGFYEIREAWQEYEPVGLPGGDTVIALPGEDTIVRFFLEEVNRYIDREIYPQVVKLENEIADSGGSPYRINKLGILYAKYGKIEDAALQFQKAVEEREYVPALINLGNVYYLRKDWQKALIFYQRAAAEDPDNDQAILCTAKVYHEMENYQLAQENYNELKKINPKLAGEFAYIDMGLSDGTRAADVIRQRESILWSDTDE
jgi:tetratricopeptide (TPR) repeat protein